MALLFALGECLQKYAQAAGAPSNSGSNVHAVVQNGWLPQSLALGSLNLGLLTITPTIDTQVDAFGEINNGWGGTFKPPLEESNSFFENSLEPGLTGDLALGNYGRLEGRVSAVFAMVGGGLNAAATNYGHLQGRDFSIDDGYGKWTSGNLFPSLGVDAIQIIGGRYTYQIGDGFLFYNGNQGGGDDVAVWLSPHHSFKQTGIVSLNSHGLLVEGFYLSPNDHPDSHTQLAGVNTELRTFEAMHVGLTYANIFHSDTPQRDGLNLIYARAEGAVIPRIKDFYLSSSLAAESNGDKVSGAYGWYVTPSYTFVQLRWQPTIYYRYASFSGGGHDGNRNFDPLFYGMSDWGTWYQGEILGNWIATNTNLNSHQIRLNLVANEQVNINLIYYHFMLDSHSQTMRSAPVKPITSTDLADEVNIIADFNLTNWWTMALMFAVDVPGRAARQITGGNQTWVQPSIWSGWNF
jgi:hypothetical protein